MHNELKQAISICALAILFLFSCTKTNSSRGILSVHSTIFSLSPDSGRFGTIDTIFGSGFAAGDSVAFNGVTATIEKLSSDTIIAIVPKHAGTGPVTVSIGGDTTRGPVFHYIFTVTVSTFSGSGLQGNTDGSATTATFEGPEGIAMDIDGNLYVSDDHVGATIRKIARDGSVTTLAGNPDSADSRDGQGKAAHFGGVDLIGIDAGGNIIIPEVDNSVIRNLSPSGMVTTIAGNGIRGYADGAPGSAEFDRPGSVAIDAVGNMYFTEQETRIRMIGTDGSVSTFAGSAVAGSADGPIATATLNWPAALTMDRSGNFYVSTDFAKIREISSSGIVSTIANNNSLLNGYVDGPAQDAEFDGFAGMIVDRSGNLYISDEGNYVIRMLSADRSTVSTLAGNGTEGHRDGPAAQAEFSWPAGMVMDSQGNIYIAEYGNLCVRKISFE
jgi:hypothetical protein